MAAQPKAPEPASAKPAAPETRKMESLLEVFSLGSKQRTVIYRTKENIEGAFWSADGSRIFFSERGLIRSVSEKGGQAQAHDIGLDRLGGSLGYSPDKKQFVVTHYTGGQGLRVYVVPVGGGEPRLLTPKAPSWWHSWSPDGKTILFVGLRQDNLDIYSIPADGGTETRLTSQPGIDDGPEFSADGQYIYFNSDRSGRNQIWRMRPDGTAPEQVTHDAYNNWYPHVSPDGKWITFLSYEEPDVKGHPQYRPVTLRLLATAGGDAVVLVRLVGGQGTYDTNSWSPDSTRIAFISYRAIQE
jgi:Tol biopolymer transport system component